MLKVTIRTPERRHWCVSIVGLEQVNVISERFFFNRINNGNWFEWSDDYKLSYLHGIINQEWKEYVCFGFTIRFTNIFFCIHPFFHSVNCSGCLSYFNLYRLQCETKYLRSSRPEMFYKKSAQKPKFFVTDSSVSVTKSVGNYRFGPI